MPWRGPSYPGEFPTLGFQVAALIQARCAIPDGDHRGEPFMLTDEQLRFLLWHYRVNPDATFDEGARRWRNAFVFDRGAQLVRPQKWGKGPLAAALICAEADPEGPVLFDGWDADGEPVGRPWRTPWIQVTGVSQDNAANVWRVLVPMIELGALTAQIPDTGETRINLPGGGRIEPVTSSARTRLGQRITLAVQDQTESWTAHNGGRQLADTQRRNLAGMGGRWIETPNAWNPIEESVAQQTSEAQEPGVYLDDVEPGTGSIRNKADRRRMLRKVYGDSWWVDLDRIDSEIVALLPRDPAQGERWFLNRKLASGGNAFDLDRWKELADSKLEVPDDALVVVGVDGARFRDALAIVGTDIERAHQFVIGIWERPSDADHDYEHPASQVDGAMRDVFERLDVWRVYVDPQFIDHLLIRWQGRWGDQRIVPWYTNRPKPMAYAVRNYADAIGAGDLSHDGNRDMQRHIGNAVREPVNVVDEEGRPMWVVSKDKPMSPRKIDAAPAGILSWECRGDAIAAGAKRRRQRSVLRTG